MRFHASCALIGFLICGDASSQGALVLPASRISTEGNSYLHLFTWQSRLASKTHSVLIPVTIGLAGRRIVEVAFRPDSYLSRLTTAPDFNVSLEVGIGHAATSAYYPNWTAAANRGKDFKVVLPKQTVRFRGNLTSGPPYPFSYRLRLTTPSPVLQFGKTALVEIRVFSSTSLQTVPVPMGLIDSHYLYDAKYAPTSFGRSCGATPVDNRLVMGQLAVGLRTVLIKFPQSAIAAGGELTVFYAGISSSSWGPAKLPLDLAPFGAKGCHVYASLDVRLPIVYRDRITFAQAVADVPNNPALAGVPVYFQAFNLGGVINPMGVTASQGLRAVVSPRPKIELSLVDRETYKFPGGPHRVILTAYGGPVLELKVQ